VLNKGPRQTSPSRSVRWPSSVAVFQRRCACSFSRPPSSMTCWPSSSSRCSSLRRFDSRCSGPRLCLRLKVDRRPGVGPLVVTAADRRPDLVVHARVRRARDRRRGPLGLLRTSPRPAWRAATPHGDLRTRRPTSLLDSGGARIRLPDRRCDRRRPHRAVRGSDSPRRPCGIADREGAGGCSSRLRSSRVLPRCDYHRGSESATFSASDSSPASDSPCPC
jgi:hypothetical protein